MECLVCFGVGHTSSSHRYYYGKRCKKCKGSGKIGHKKRNRRTLRGKARRHPLSVAKRKRRRAL